MSKRRPAAVTVGITVIARSVLSVALAMTGGVPRSTKPCPTHGHSGGHRGSGRDKKERRE
jgi:hypothetical protein